jgi:UDP-N-acetylmuramoyl-tripeptide--D-alanyl-D-alanine ligase
MNTLSLEEAARWCGASPKGQAYGLQIAGISTDTRTISPADLFIPLSGENFNGHRFIKEALQKGAVAFVSHEEVPPDLADIPHFQVADTLLAYQEIARNYLARFNVPVVAITGSNGKTTTKDMVTHILGEKMKVLSTEKNFNNEVGVPATVMQLDPSHQVLVVEMAMRGEGQIRQLARIARPDAAVITNIGESHFELLGSYEAIARAKCEILEYLNPQGYAILNADDKWFPFCLAKAPASVATFGIRNEADVRLINLQDRGLKGSLMQVAIDRRIHGFELPLLGEHNVYNALCAIAVARCLRMTPAEIAAGMKTLTPSDKRMEILRHPAGWVFLNDTYNASPSSTKRALEILGSLPRQGRKMAVLADMLELGDIAVEAHREVGRFAGSKGVDLLFTMGDLGAEIGAGALSQGMDRDRVRHFARKGELIDELSRILQGGDMVLVKGSRRMKMDEIPGALLGPVEEKV